MFVLVNSGFMFLLFNNRTTSDVAFASRSSDRLDASDAKSNKKWYLRWSESQKGTQFQNYDMETDDILLVYSVCVSVC